jgi:hypothetical protein
MPTGKRPLRSPCPGCGTSRKRCCGSSRI